MKNEMFFVIAHNLSLDFVNTLIVEDGVEKDLLVDFSQLVDWALTVKILDPDKAEGLRLKWLGTREAGAALEAARVFRSTLLEMVRAIAAGHRVGAHVLDAINSQLRDRMGSSVIRPTEEGYDKVFIAEFRDPVQILVPIAESAADLLCYADPGLIRKCQNPECVLYFYDISKNHRRRWCSMAGCGNRAKVNAFYKRSRSKDGNHPAKAVDRQPAN